jgi:hypothetical protein
MKKIGKLIGKIKFFYKKKYRFHGRYYPPHYVDIGRRT